jgi:cytochrome c biogenesis protein CcmG, thiol:disulfide interchange protein DsbE
MQTLPAEDRPSPPPSRRRPYGLMAASLLAAVVLVVAFAVAFTMDDGTGDGGEPVIELGGEPSFTVPGLVATDRTGQPVPGEPFETADGDTVALAELAGTPLVVNFFNSRCTPCITEMPALQAASEALGDEVAFVGVDTLDDPADGDALVERTGVDYLVLRDPDGALIEDFGGIGLPTTAFVDADGRIRAVQLKALDEEQILDLVAEHLGVQP